jgi:hypothetical protein
VRTDDNFFSASEVRWQDEAQCSGAPADFTPTTESARTLEYVRTGWCNTCPVRTECLAYALLYHLSGYWGGTDTALRRKLASRRDRVKCPDCRSKAVVHIEGCEICQHCGVSWAGNSSPLLSREAAG